MNPQVHVSQNAIVSEINLEGRYFEKKNNNKNIILKKLHLLSM